jgi:hypothetical protein
MKMRMAQTIPKAGLTWVDIQSIRSEASDIFSEFISLKIFSLCKCVNITLV